MTDLANTTLAAISSDIARLIRDRIGRGPRRTRVLWADDDVLVVLMDNGLTPAEQTLRHGGHGEDVVHGRTTLQLLMRSELMAIVERATERPVLSVLSSTGLDPDVSVDVFLLDGEVTERDLVAESYALQAESRQARRHSSERREARRTESDPQARR